MESERASLFERRYGVRRDRRVPFAVRWRWPLRSPVTIAKLHRFDADATHCWHSSDCWCRRG